MWIDEFYLDLVGYACPEQYEVYDDENKQVGYLRLRHGYFAAYLTDHYGERVYEARTEGDGIFEEHEREYFLTQAVRAIRVALRNREC